MWNCIFEEHPQVCIANWGQISENKRFHYNSRILLRQLPLTAFLSRDWSFEVDGIRQVLCLTFRLSSQGPNSSCKTKRLLQIGMQFFSKSFRPTPRFASLSEFFHIQISYKCQLSFVTKILYLIWLVGALAIFIAGREADAPTKHS